MIVKIWALQGKEAESAVPEGPWQVRCRFPKPCQRTLALLPGRAVLPAALLVPSRAELPFGVLPAWLLPCGCLAWTAIISNPKSSSTSAPAPFLPGPLTGHPTSPAVSHHPGESQSQAFSSPASIASPWAPSEGPPSPVAGDKAGRG